MYLCISSYSDSSLFRFLVCWCFDLLIFFFLASCIETSDFMISAHLVSHPCTLQDSYLLFLFSFVMSTLQIFWFLGQLLFWWAVYFFNSGFITLINTARRLTFSSSKQMTINCFGSWFSELLTLIFWPFNSSIYHASVLWPLDVFFSYS